MEDKPNFKFEPLNISVYLIRIIFLIVISLCIINFKLNNLAFSIFIGFAVLIIFLSFNSCLLIYNDRVEIIRRRLIKPFNSKSIYRFEEISSIEYDKSSLNPLNLLYYLPYINNQKQYIIKYNTDNKEEYVNIKGSKKQLLLAVNIINQEIQKFNRNYGKHKI